MYSCTHAVIFGLPSCGHVDFHSSVSLLSFRSAASTSSAGFRFLNVPGCEDIDSGALSGTLSVAMVVWHRWAPPLNHPLAPRPACRNTGPHTQVQPSQVERVVFQSEERQFKLRLFFFSSHVHVLTRRPCRSRVDGLD